ncbi:hypothetical protein ACWDPV_01220 [Gordonia sp. NPDC003504]
MTPIPAHLPLDAVIDDRDQSFDWAGFEEFVVGEIVAAVAHWIGTHPRRVPGRAALFDFHVRDMLILFPIIAIDDEPHSHADWRPEDWDWQQDSGPDADAWAGRITASVGSGGGRWAAVVQRFFAALAAASRAATACLRALNSVTDDFLVVVLNGDDDQIVACVPPGRLALDFPAIEARRSEIARLTSLSVTARTTELIRALAETRTSPLTRDEMTGQLRKCGAGAAAAVAERICAQGPATGPDWVSILDAMGSVPDHAAEHLRLVIADTERPLAHRASVAASMAWLGRLGDVVEDLTDLPDELVVSVVSRAYLGDHKNARLEYASLERVLASRPHLDQVLVEQLSPTRMFSIAEGDSGAAMAGLASRWVFVRRHAAIVLLTVHI